MISSHGPDATNPCHTDQNEPASQLINAVVYELPIYKSLKCDPKGPRLARSYKFRKFDPYCPEDYECEDYDHDAVWFDGKNEGDLRFTIDLEAGSMDR